MPMIAMIRAISSRYGPATFGWMCFFGVNTIFYAFVIPGFIAQFESIGVGLTIFSLLLAVGVSANYCMASFMDPGIIPPSTPGEEGQQDALSIPSYKNAIVRGMTVRMKWCFTCHFYRPPKCSHCSVCEHCIEGYDHHCPWLNNCIARRNYKQFCTFLLLVCVHNTTVFAYCLIYTLRTSDKLLTQGNVGSILVMLLDGLLSLPVFILTSYHVFLTVRGRTTNEQLHGKFRSGYNPFNDGVCHNILSLFFSPQYPRLSAYAGHQDVPEYMPKNCPTKVIDKKMRRSRRFVSK